MADHVGPGHARCCTCPLTLNLRQTCDHSLMAWSRWSTHACGSPCICLVLGVVYLGFLFRKSESCQCGCRGWCSYFPLLSAQTLDLNSGAARVHQHKKVFDIDFDVETEQYFLEMSGRQMDIAVVVVQLRCDMPAWCWGAGMRHHGHKHHPCTLCRKTKSELKS